MSEQAPQAAQPQQIQPQPLPTQVTMTQATVTTPDGGRQQLLMWQISTPAGTTVLFTDRAFTEQLAQMLGQHLQRWPAGLVVPTVDLEQIRAALANGKPAGQGK
jgi:hypothetical protein